MFNFDNFKKKTKEVTEVQAVETLDRPKSMPKQKSKSGFSFFSSKDKRSLTLSPDSETPPGTENTTSQIPAPRQKPKLFSKPFGKDSINHVQSDESQIINDETSQTLAENIVAELMKSSANHADVIQKVCSPDENVDKSMFSRGSARSSVRHTKNKNKKEDCKIEESKQDQEEGFPQKRSESKSRFSIKMPKKKSKEKA